VATRPVRGGRPGKLVNAVRVMLYFPPWGISCGVCESYLRKTDGTFMRDAAGVLQPRSGVVTLPTPCGTCPKVAKHLRDCYPDDIPKLRAAADELTPANRQFWEFYNSQKAVGWTEAAKADPIVRFLAGGLRELEDRHARDAADRTHETTAAVIELVVKQLLRR
jgi:hypothetical protein